MCLWYTKEKFLQANGFLSMNLILLLIYSPLLFRRFFSSSTLLQFVYQSGSSYYIHFPFMCSCFALIEAFWDHQHQSRRCFAFLSLQRNSNVGRFALRHSRTNSPTRTQPKLEKIIILFSTDLCDRRKIKPHCYFACRNDNTLFWISPPLWRNIQRKNKYFDSPKERKNKVKEFFLEKSWKTFLSRGEKF